MAGRLDFGGTAMQLFGWMLLSTVSFLLVIPAAWVYAAMARWFCRSLKFSDGTTAIFRGTGGQVVGWWVFLILVVFGLNFATRASGAGIGPVILTLLAYLVISTGIVLKLIGWAVSNVQLSSGPPLSFSGTYGGYLGWNALLMCSIYTIIGYAWAEAAMVRRLARNTRGVGVEFQFHGKGHQLLWRMFVVILTFPLIIPLPWMSLWLFRWVIQSISMNRSERVPAVASPVLHQT